MRKPEKARSNDPPKPLRHPPSQDKTYRMSLEIYGFPHSPFCIAVESALRAFGLPFVSRRVPAWDRSEILRLTGGAYYEVPVLVHDRSVLWESSEHSQDIARYLDRHFASGRLFPERFDGLQDLALHYLENEVEGITFRLFDPSYIDSIEDVAQRGMVIRHKERKFGRGCVERWKAERSELIAEAETRLKPFERMLSHQRFLFGDRPVYADFLLAGILGNMVFGGRQKIPGNLPALENFHREITDFRYPSA